MIDKLVFSKIKERLGGRIRLMISGSAPLSPTLHEFLEVYVLSRGTQDSLIIANGSVFCCPVLQGYGLSETAACALFLLQIPKYTDTLDSLLPVMVLKDDSLAVSSI